MIQGEPFESGLTAICRIEILVAVPFVSNALKELLNAILLCVSDPRSNRGRKPFSPKLPHVCPLCALHYCNAMPNFCCDSIVPSRGYEHPHRYVSGRKPARRPMPASAFREAS